MRSLWYATACVLLGGPAFGSPPGTETAESAETGERGPSVGSLLPEDVTMDVFGRLHNDWTWATGDDAFDTDDGVEFRRARIGVSGTLFDLVDYKAEYDFAGKDADFKDVYVAVKGTPAGKLQVGHFKEPFSLEELTSSRHILFNERSVANTFAPARNNGLMASDRLDTGNVNWQIGVFRDTDDAATDNAGDPPDAETDAEYAFTGRLAGTVVHDDAEARVVHLGAAYSFRQADDGAASFSSRPEAHLLNPVASASLTDVENVQLLGLESAWVHGSVSLQGEYVHTRVNVDGGSDADYGGWYVQGSYFLTGEHRNYDVKGARFGRVRPLENVTRSGGKGAHELALRYSMLDLDDGPSQDELSNVTFGWNWYLNPHAAVKLNYVRSMFESGSVDDDADIVVVRFQVDF